MHNKSPHNPENTVFVEPQGVIFISICLSITMTMLEAYLFTFLFCFPLRVLSLPLDLISAVKVGTCAWHISHTEVCISQRTLLALLK